MSNQWSVVKEGDASAQHTGATRNTDAERGVGRAWRHEPDMTPVSPSVVTKHSNRRWKQGAAIDNKTDLIGQTKNLNVAVRSGNINPAAVGIAASNWGIAGFGDDAAPAPAKSSTTPIIIGLLALGAGIYLLRK